MKKRICSFCGKTIEDEKDMIKGIDSYICLKCIDTCVNVRKRDELKHKFSCFKYTPRMLKENLDEYVVGQDEAKKILSVEIYNHYKRIKSRDESIEKTNILLIGSSGSGKTYLVKTLAKILDVPLYIADATEYTENGYKGKDVEDIMKGLLYEADYDVDKAMEGIVYIDEIDKLASIESDNLQRDVSGKGVQKTLLKLIEGYEYTLDKNHKVDTSKILFIFGGAFEGLNKQIAKSRYKNDKKIGFMSENKIEEKEKENYDIKTDDLIEYGFMKEFIGRIPLIAQLNELSKEDMKRILISTKSPLLQQYKKLLALDDVDLTFSDEAIDFIAEEACKKNIGARGLKSILSKKMNDLMFELPDSNKDKFEVTKELLEG